mmetsp:Transcript_7197/g.14722  ORF Transcript_7197/g.14722 Transcript_7197/m.14722 type:complete len:154 (-) Transcript_7197:178-639(-)
MRSLFALLLCVLSASAEVLEVSNWVVPPKSDPFYPGMDAVVGDEIVFTWPAGMIIDVHLHPTGTCEEDGAIKVGYVSPASYTFTEEDAGKELFFACDVGRRCEAGQSIKVTVASLPVEAKVDAIEAGIDSAARTNGVLSALVIAAFTANVMML